MKRDAALTREILLKVEGLPQDGGEVVIQGHANSEVSDHIRSMKDEDLLVIEKSTLHPEEPEYVKRLTVKGRDLLEQLR